MRCSCFDDASCSCADTIQKLYLVLVFMPLRVAGGWATARGGGFSPETVPTGFRHLPAGRRYALHP
jgi:hypothetical protein